MNEFHQLPHPYMAYEINAEGDVYRRAARGTATTFGKQRLSRVRITPQKSGSIRLRHSVNKSVITHPVADLVEMAMPTLGQTA